MEAFLPSLNQRVIIVSNPDNKGEVQVEACIMKINVKLKELRKVNEETKKKEKKKRKPGYKKKIKRAIKRDEQQKRRIARRQARKMK